VTVSLRHLAEDGRIYVFGADITLDALSSFLGTLEIGERGQALLMDSTGRLIASPHARPALKETNGTLMTARADELGDRVVAGAYDRYRVEGPGRRIIEIDGNRYITAVTPLPAAARDWLVLMTVPEEDFVGFVASNNRSALLMSLGVVAVAAILAFVLVRQGLRADRNARLLRERERALQREGEAFSKLADAASLFDPASGTPPRALTETLADVSGARRASVWRLVGGRILRCEDSFDRDTGGHVEGLELHRDELPQFFKQLLKGEEIDTPDAAADRRTSELHRIVMDPLGSRALFAVPVRRDDKVVGVMWLEDAHGAADAHEFVRAAANLIAMRMPETTPAAARKPAAAAPAAPIEAPRSFTAELARRGIDPTTVDGDVYPDIAVMVVHFMDPTALSVRAPEAAQALSNQIACALQATARKHNIPYLKIVGQDIVAAAGLGAADGSGAPLIAQAALAVRDHCLTLFENNDHRQEFRIGLDCGGAIGTNIGNEPRVFNLWGEAVRVATSMSASAWPGTIQATHAAYERLRHDFLFRPRGRFYLPGVGESRTYVLAGRL
jgi:class 3 adenylate cyclase